MNKLNFDFKFDNWNFTNIKKKIFQKVSLLNNYNIILWIIICFGFILRLVQYLFNRSLWVDEVKPALYIIDCSFSEFLKPCHLEWCSPAPIGYLMLEKLLIQVFGSSEYVLRLFPFLCGVISLFLFYKVAKHYINRKAALIALFFFAISPWLVYYSTELKQYSSDLAIALLLYLVTIYIPSKSLTASRIVLSGIIGAVVIWFSHPSIFILAGIGMSLTLSYLIKKEWLKIGKLSIICSIWILSFTAYYFVSLRNWIPKLSSKGIWSGSFMPFPPDIKWFSAKLLNFLKMPMGLSSFPNIVALTFIIGCVSIFLKKREEFFGLISPIFFTLLASAIRKYPISGRLLLYIVPIVLIFVVEGIEHIRVKTYNYSTIIVITLIGLLVLNPLMDSSYHLLKPYTKEEIKPVLAYIRENKQNGDLIYVYYASRVAFRYYLERYGFKDNDYIVGVSSRYNPENYISDLDKLHGNKRVWILFSHVHQDEKGFFLNYLNIKGKIIDSFEAKGASVYLYDLNKL